MLILFLLFRLRYSIGRLKTQPNRNGFDKSFWIFFLNPKRTKCLAQTEQQVWNCCDVARSQWFDNVLWVCAKSSLEHQTGDGWVPMSIIISKSRASVKSMCCPGWNDDARRCCSAMSITNNPINSYMLDQTLTVISHEIHFFGIIIFFVSLLLLFSLLNSMRIRVHGGQISHNNWYNFKYFFLLLQDHQMHK